MSDVVLINKGVTQMVQLNEDRALAVTVGRRLGMDFNKIDIDQFSKGLAVELEHGARDPETNVTNNDLIMTGKIAWAHLKELPDYYTRLEKMEAEAEGA
jgi:hypothetical protein